MDKLIPKLILRSEIEMAEKEAEWTVYSNWFINQKEFRVKIFKKPEISILL